MCGIAGVLNPRAEGAALVTRMVSTLEHRGPDQAGIYADPGVALGHCRLSIVGLDDGCQPIANEDGTLWIVYNGEIFNYPELRRELEAKGHRFATATDTEVLLHLYEEYGSEGLKLLIGQFAFAIWDSLKRELFLARDRVGIRPLYYHQAPGSLFFASEIKALLVAAPLTPELDPVALHQVFSFWTTLTPRTCFNGVLELPPGHYLVAREGRVVEQQAFWQLPYYPPEARYSGSREQAVEELQTLLLDAVRLRLRADVPVGAYLSGGLDSSIITTLICRHFNNRLNTFSLAFQEGAFDETRYQRELVQRLGTEHQELLIGNRDIREALPQVVLHCEKPLLRSAPVPMFLLSRLVRQHGFKVVLTGEGADELFGGYDIFKEDKIRRYWQRLPLSARRPRLLERLHPYIFSEPGRARMMLQKFYAVKEGELDDPCFSHRIRWGNCGKNRLFFSQQTLARVAGYCGEEALAARLPQGFGAREPLARAEFLEMDIFLSNYLLSSQGDRVAMANSLELRLPFLDHRLIDFAARLPPSWKIKGLNEKYLLKKAFGELLPQSIVRRPKQPYRAPIRELFFSGASDYVDELLSETALRRSGYFDPAKCRLLVEKFRNGSQTVASESQNMALMGILTTQLLHHHFIETSSAALVRPISITRHIIRL